MSNNIWEDLEFYLNEKKIGCVSSGVNENEILNAELNLGLRFNDVYKNILLKYGALGIEDTDIHGLRHLPLMDKYRWSVIEKTNFYKNEQKWPNINDWYIISDDGRGNPIGCKPDGSVWLSDHDAGFEQIKLADDFEQFLHKLLTDTLYD